MNQQGRTNDVTTPIWLLDVDGVLNALPWYVRDQGRDVSDPPWPDYTTVQASPDADDPRRYVITYSPTLVQRIVALHESGVVEVRWLTTWGSGANGELRRKLGIPKLEVAGEPPVVTSYRDVHAEPQWWKFPYARKVRAENPGRPLIWTDDDLVCRAASRAREWLSTEDDVFAVAPDEAHGLTPRHLDAIEAFIVEGAERVA